jgi:hypothetical protein
VQHSITEPTPTLTALNPSQIPGGTHRINFTGTGFRGTTGKVTQGGYWANHVCTFTSATTGYFDTSLIPSSPTAGISVANNTGNQSYSNSLPLTLVPPPPVINSISEDVVDNTSNSFYIDGANFYSTIEVHMWASGWNEVRWPEGPNIIVQSTTRIWVNGAWLGDGLCGGPQWYMRIEKGPYGNSNDFPFHMYCG